MLFTRDSRLCREQLTLRASVEEESAVLKEIPGDVGDLLDLFGHDGRIDAADRLQ